MKCPKCNEGEIHLYKETEKTFYIPLNKDNTISKRKSRWSVIEHDTSKDYLECDSCSDWFDYHIDDKGRVILEGERFV